MENKKPIPVNHYQDGTTSVLRKAVVFTELRFYQKSDVLYQLTQLFCHRYLPKYGDRTVDQMVQAARSTKQNIAEGSSDGQTSTETELKLLGIARGSNLELLEDYQDYLKRHGLADWFGRSSRYEPMLQFCRKHNKYEEYKPFMAKMNDEELANMAICLCHQVDRALTSYIGRKDREFTTEGGIRERMTAARIEQRTSQKETIERLMGDNERLKQDNECLEREIIALKNTEAALRSEIARLTALLGEKEE